MLKTNQKFNRMSDFLIFCHVRQQQTTVKETSINVNQENQPEDNVKKRHPKKQKECNKYTENLLQPFQASRLKTRKS